MSIIILKTTQTDFMCGVFGHTWQHKVLGKGVKHVSLWRLSSVSAVGVRSGEFKPRSGTMKISVQLI